MANTFDGNVWRVDTNTNFPVALKICGIKYIGASSGTAIISAAVAATDGTGDKLWQEAGTPNLPTDSVDIYAKDGIYVTLTNSALVYIYLE